MHQLVNQLLVLRLRQNVDIREMLPDLEARVERQQLTPYAAARQIMEKL